MVGLRLVQPLIHASSLMQDYQRSVLSLKLLAQLMQTAPEPSSGQLAPTIRGHLEFDSVTFHYPASRHPRSKKSPSRSSPARSSASSAAAARARRRSRG